MLMPVRERGSSSRFCLLLIDMPDERLSCLMGVAGVVLLIFFDSGLKILTGVAGAGFFVVACVIVVVWSVGAGNGGMSLSSAKKNRLRMRARRMAPPMSREMVLG